MALIHLPLMLWCLMMNTTFTSQMAAIIWTHNRMCWWIAPALAILILYANGRSAEKKRICENLSDICLSNLTIEATGCVVCNGTNVLGSVSSNATSFVVVPNPSEYEYLASSNNIFQQMPENKINVLQQENSRWLWMEMPQPMLRSCKDRKWTCFALLTIPMNWEQTFHGLLKHCLGLLLVQTRYLKQILLEMQLEIILANFWLVW